MLFSCIDVLEDSLSAPPPLFNFSLILVEHVPRQLRGEGRWWAGNCTSCLHLLHIYPSLYTSTIFPLHLIYSSSYLHNISLVHSSSLLIPMPPLYLPLAIPTPYLPLSVYLYSIFTPVHTSTLFSVRIDPTSFNPVHACTIYTSASPHLHHIYPIPLPFIPLSVYTSTIFIP